MVNPSVQHAPKARASQGQAAFDLAESCGLVLDDWQRHALELGLQTTGRGKTRRWAAFEVGIDLPRQNGKNAIIAARELAGLFLFGERLQIHSAHQFDTSLEHFRLLEDLIYENPELRRQVKKVSRSHGEEGIELKNGQRIRFRTRTKGGGRGFACDCLLLDEAMVLPEMAHGALLPTLSARPNPQVWYTGSAVDQFVHEHGVVWARVRDRGIRGEPGLVYLEWSARGEMSALDGIIDDRNEWLQANPALGSRISLDHIAAERRSMDARTFAVERLGIGDWPPLETQTANALDFESWSKLAENSSRMLDPICLAFDVTPDRGRATIAAAGRRGDGLFHVETVDQRRGTGWLTPRIIELLARWNVFSVTCDPASPAAAVVRVLEEQGVEVETTTARDYSSACGLFYDLIEQRQLRHLGSDELSVAVKNASTRPLGEAWAWSRKLSSADISPLVAATLALWAASAKLGSVYDERGLIAV